MTTTRISTPDITTGHVITIAGEIGTVLEVAEARGRTGRRHLTVEHNDAGQRYERRYSVGAHESFHLHREG